MGILLAAVMPRIGGAGGREQLRRDVRRLVGQAALAHSLAASQSRPYFLCLDLDEDRIWLSTVRPGREGDAGAEGESFHLSREVIIADAEHAVSGLTTDGRLAFGYWPQGGNESGAVRLKNSDGEVVTVFIKPYLGRTRVEEGYFREETR